ncbi:hypothetical protein C8R46DRAFT_1088344 [Mycena filopes]|nr:hypothetical protein C8R46DRAFT_1088344 [Mycena filopes]
MYLTCLLAVSAIGWVKNTTGTESHSVQRTGHISDQTQALKDTMGSIMTHLNMLHRAPTVPTARTKSVFMRG